MTEPADRYERCSVQAALRGDPMIGSAFPAGRLLLVEQPGPWGRAGLLASRFDTRIAHRLVAELERREIRVVAIRRPGRHVPDGAPRWAAVDCRPERERIVWGRFANESDLLSLDVPGRLDASVGDSEEIEPLYLVCAHGTHDACCAIFGRPVAAALEAQRPGRVWECSHVGGDRFAANVLVLPSGLLYGRVRADQARDLVRRTDAGTVDPAGLRGRVGFPSAEQAAMVLAHEAFPATGWREISVVRTDRTDPGRVRVTLAVAGRPVEVAVRARRADPAWLTCQSGAQGRAVVYEPALIR